MRRGLACTCIISIYFNVYSIPSPTGVVEVHCLWNYLLTQLRALSHNLPSTSPRHQIYDLLILAQSYLGGGRRQWGIRGQKHLEPSLPTLGSWDPTFGPDRMGISDLLSSDRKGFKCHPRNETFSFELRSPCCIHEGRSQIYYRL